MRIPRDEARPVVSRREGGASEFLTFIDIAVDPDGRLQYGKQPRGFGSTENGGVAYAAKDPLHREPGVSGLECGEVEVRRVFNRTDVATTITDGKGGNAVDA